jgi:hypothetical protein
MYLSQTYSSDDCDDYDENKSLKTIGNCIRRCIRLMLMLMLMLMLKRLCEREKVFNKSLVSIKIATKIVDNRVAPVPSTTKTRQHQSSEA